jgi:hypothetical protein
MEPGSDLVISHRDRSARYEFDRIQGKHRRNNKIKGKIKSSRTSSGI